MTEKAGAQHSRFKAKNKTWHLQRELAEIFFEFRVHHSSKMSNVFDEIFLRVPDSGFVVGVNFNEQLVVASVDGGPGKHACAEAPCRVVSESGSVYIFERAMNDPIPIGTGWGSERVVSEEGLLGVLQLLVCHVARRFSAMEDEELPDGDLVTARCTLADSQVLSVRIE